MKSIIPFRTGRVLLMAECVTLFFAVPAGLYFIRHWFAWRVTPIVLALSLLCGLLLLCDREFDRGKLWGTTRFGAHLKAILAAFVAPAVLVGAFTYFFHRPLFLYFVSAEPWLWLVFVLFYPLLACYPQELLFRAFFFHRYGPLFRRRGALIVLSGLSFGLSHLFYGNPLALVLSTLGGMLFAYRYATAESLVASTVEHGLWGSFLFTIGLGWYFYSGSIR